MPRIHFVYLIRLTNAWQLDDFSQFRCLSTAIYCLQTAWDVRNIPWVDAQLRALQYHTAGCSITEASNDGDREVHLYWGTSRGSGIRGAAGESASVYTIVSLSRVVSRCCIHCLKRTCIAVKQGYNVLKFVSPERKKECVCLYIVSSGRRSVTN